MSEEKKPEKPAHHHLPDGMTPSAKNLVAVLASLVSLCLALVVGLNLNIGEYLSSRVDAELKERTTAIDREHLQIVAAQSNKHDLVMALSAQVATLAKTQEALRLNNERLKNTLAQLQIAHERCMSMNTALKKEIDALKQSRKK